MKRIEIHGPDDARLVDVPEPEAGPDDIVVAVKACGICGSDMHFLSIGALVPEMAGTPLPIGHEFSGIVETVGDNVKAIAAGDRVVVNPGAAGSIGFGGTEGAFGEKVLVPGATLNGNVFHLPDSLGFELGALVEPLNVGLHAVNRSEVKAGDKVVVFGAGPIGLSALATLVRRGFEDLVAIDLSENRLAIARKLGVPHTLNGGAEDIWARLRELHNTSEHHGQPFCASDAYIEASGAGFLIPDIIANARFGATLTLVAGYKDEVSVPFNTVMDKQLSIRGSAMYSDDFSEPIDLLQELDASAMISHRFPLDRFDDAMSAMKDAARSAKVIVEI